MGKMFAQLCSIEESLKSYESPPHLTSHVTRIEKPLTLSPH